MLYTRKGDGGTTKAFDSGPGVRISKSSSLAEALGLLDEANSYIGLCKAKVAEERFTVSDKKVSDILHDVQNDLFIIQAQVAGADKQVSEAHVKKLEEIADAIEKELPPITTFLIPGANEISAHFDFARALSRRAERRVVAVSEERAGKINPHTLAYLNRLSSLLYALARFSAHTFGHPEKAPTY
jgi:cob(I)alamin adenosyltransferase